MKKIKIIGLLLLTIVVIFFLGVWVLLKTLDINSFKGQITQEISKSINREVTIKRISLKCSIPKGATLNISGLTVAGYPDLPSEAILYVDSTHLTIDILSLILKREILISSVKLDSPKINLIRDSKKKLNVQNFSTQDKNRTNDIKVGEAKPSEESSKKSAKKNKKKFTFGDLLVKSILITDGAFIFTDQTTDSTVTIPVTQIDFQILNLSFDAAFSFKGQASLWSGGQNMRINGSSQIDARNQQVRVDDLKVHINYSDMEFTKIEESIPALKASGIEDTIGGQLVIDVSQMILGKEGLLVLSSEGRLTEGEIHFKNSPIPIKDLNMHLELSESDLEIKEIRMPLASGELNLSGQIVEYLEEQKFLGNLNIENIHLHELGVLMDLPIKLEGKIHGSFKGDGKGLSESAVMSSLAGEGNIEVKEGRLLDINILKFVLSKLSFIPDLLNQVEANLPDRYKEKLTQQDTLLEKVMLDTRIRNGILTINQAELNADGFLVLAKGDFNFNQNLFLEADFYIAEDLSSGMVRGSQELSYLLNERGQIHVPLKSYRGKLKNFYMYPDVGDLGKKVIRNRGKEELKKVIFKALDIDVKPSEPLKEGESNPQAPEVRPEDAIIENILDMIPIFE